MPARWGSFYIEILLFGKLQFGAIPLSTMPIIGHHVFIFRKISTLFRLSFIGCPLKLEDTRHQMLSNVFYKVLNSLILSPCADYIASIHRAHRLYDKDEIATNRKELTYG